MEKNDTEFWNSLDHLIKSNSIKIDRPKGSVHPKYSDYVYPYDYGFVSNTTSTDGAEIDCWIGSHRIDSKKVCGVIATFDSVKNDSEMKILINCSDSDMKEILKCHNRGDMCGMLVVRNLKVEPHSICLKK